VYLAGLDAFAAWVASGVAPSHDAFAGLQEAAAEYGPGGALHAAALQLKRSRPVTAVMRAQEPSLRPGATTAIVRAHARTGLLRGSHPSPVFLLPDWLLAGAADGVLRREAKEAAVGLLRGWLAAPALPAHALTPAALSSRVTLTCLAHERALQAASAALQALLAAPLSLEHAVPCVDGGWAAKWRALLASRYRPESLSEAGSGRIARVHVPRPQPPPLPPARVSRGLVAATRLPQQAPAGDLAPQRGEDGRRRRHDQGRDPAETAPRLPAGEQGDEQERRGQPFPHGAASIAWRSSRQSALKAGP
jgi:hypothetical protein